MIGLLTTNPRQADIIKVGHHGSGTSSSEKFIRTVSPGFAVISCGLNNRYGHPSDEVVELLEKSGIIYGRTDYDGAIYIESIKNGIITLRNAAKDKTWHTAVQNQIQNTLQKP